MRMLPSASLSMPKRRAVPREELREQRLERTAACGGTPYLHQVGDGEPPVSVDDSTTESLVWVPPETGEFLADLLIWIRGTSTFVIGRWGSVGYPAFVRTHAASMAPEAIRLDIRRATQFTVKTAEETDPLGSRGAGVWGRWRKRALDSR